MTTDTTYVPVDFGPPETERLIDSTGLEYTVDRTIEYDYDNLYRLTSAAYSTGNLYEYEYDPVGNRLKQIIDGDTTEYLYDVANRLTSVDGQNYTFDNNGNLLSSGVMTNTWDAANRLVETIRDNYTLEPIYNGVGDRVGQTAGVTTTHFALDIQGLPEVIYTSADNAYLHLPGVIMTENSSGEIRYLLSDGLGSVRQAVDEAGVVVAYNEFDPYGNPVENGSEPYGFTGEWWQDEVGLLHLRARWLMPETGTFLSRDPVESEPAYRYVRGNPVNRVDPSGQFSMESIRRSLGGRNPYAAFVNRAGLFYLLRKAEPLDVVSPMVVDFGSNQTAMDMLFAGVNYRSDYPLLGPRDESVMKGLDCRHGKLVLMKRLGGGWGDNDYIDLNRYLDLLETV